MISVEIISSVNIVLVPAIPQQEVYAKSPLRGVVQFMTQFVVVMNKPTVMTVYGRELKYQKHMMVSALAILVETTSSVNLMQALVAHQLEESASWFLISVQLYMTQSAVVMAKPMEMIVNVEEPKYQRLLMAHACRTTNIFW